MKRWRARARGRVGKIIKPFPRLTIIVKEEKLDHVDQKTQSSVKKGKIENKAKDSTKNVKSTKKESTKTTTESQKTDSSKSKDSETKEGKT